MNRNRVLHLLIRFCAAGLGTSIFFVFIWPFTASWISPHLCGPLRLIYPKHHLETHYDKGLLVVSGTVLVDMTGAYEGKIAEIEFSTSILQGTIAILPIIAFSLIMAWPGLTHLNRLKALLLAFPLCLAFTWLDITLTLLYIIESKIMTESFVFSLLRFISLALNRGGRQFLGIAACLLSIAPFTLLKHLPIDRPVSRNASCPCGSGKKYKHCCLK